MKKIELPYELVDNLVNYLSQKPYVEVYRFINEIQSKGVVKDESQG